MHDNDKAKCYRAGEEYARGQIAKGEPATQLLPSCADWRAGYAAGRAAG